ncbi:hypothetical protein JST97_21860 [bacterium]|nr:hypothetical protein [bacterium]
MLEVVLDGLRFRWNGRAWVDEMGRVGQSGAKLGQTFLQRFFARHGFDWQALSQCWFREGLDICAPESLKMLASACAERLGDCEEAPWLALLCQCCRHLRQTELALNLAESNLYRNDPQILTCHAAVLCDLGRWQEAEAIVQRALCSGAGQEAKSVRYRILAQRAARGLR